MTSSILSDVSLILCIFSCAAGYFRDAQTAQLEGVVGLGGAKNVRIFEGETLKETTDQNHPKPSSISGMR